MTMTTMMPANEFRSGKSHRDENFPVASRLIHPRHRGAILAFYNFVRIADDIADHPTLDPQKKLDQLDAPGSKACWVQDDANPRRWRCARPCKNAASARAMRKTCSRPFAWT